MARLPRLSQPGVAHYLLQRGHNRSAIALDAQDVDRLVQTLREAALSSGVTLHAYAVAGNELHVLATPDTPSGASRMMQALGRRYAAAFNRRHGRSGGLWDGRFRSALIEPGSFRLLALQRIDALGVVVAGQPPSVGSDDVAPSAAGASTAAAVPRSSAPHRTGGRRDAALVDPPEYWDLGNTPFERESRYGALLAEPLPGEQGRALDDAVRGSWAVGTAAFLQGLGESTSRPVAPRPRGRPRRGP
jgi:putative transposase